MEFHCNPYKEKNCKELNEVDSFRAFAYYIHIVKYIFLL